MFGNLCVFLIVISITIEGGQFVVEKAGLRLSVKVGVTSSITFVIWVGQTLQQLAKADSRAGGLQILSATGRHLSLWLFLSQRYHICVPEYVWVLSLAKDLGEVQSLLSTGSQDCVSPA